MKKIILFFCCLAMANIAFTQIKANKTITKSYEPVRQNVAILAALNSNTDSVEIQQLFEAYKIADADATNKLEKLLAKIKAVNANNANKIDEKKKAETEIEMATVEQLMQKRAALFQYVTNIIKSMNEEQKKIMDNIR